MNRPAPAAMLGAALFRLNDQTRMVALLYPVFLGIAALAAAVSPVGDKPSSVAAMLFGMAALTWSALFTGRGLTIGIALAALRTPRSTETVVLGLFAPLLAGVALPAMLGLLLGLPPAAVGVAVAYGALLGMLMMLMPHWGLLLAVIAWSIALQLPAESRPWPPAAVGIGALLLVNGLLAWHSTRRPGLPIAGWARPLALATAGDSPWFAAPRYGSNPLAGALNRLHGNPKTMRPDHRMAIALGGHFRHVSWRGLLRQQAPLLAVIVLMSLFGNRGDTQPTTYAAIFLVVSVIFPASHLLELRRRPSAEFAELALLPGLAGDLGLTRRLRRVAVQAVLRLTLPLALFAFVVAVWHGMPAPAFRALALVTLTAIVAGSALAWWAVVPRRRPGIALAIVLVCAQIILTMLLAFTQIEAQRPVGGAVEAVVLGLVALLVASALFARREQDRAPHPFMHPLEHTDAGTAPQRPIAADPH